MGSVTSRKGLQRARLENTGCRPGPCTSDYTTGRKSDFINLFSALAKISLFSVLSILAMSEKNPVTDWRPETCLQSVRQSCRTRFIEAWVVRIFVCQIQAASASSLCSAVVRLRYRTSCSLENRAYSLEARSANTEPKPNSQVTM